MARNDTTWTTLEARDKLCHQHYDAREYHKPRRSVDRERWEANVDKPNGEEHYEGHRHRYFILF